VGVVEPMDARRSRATELGAEIAVAPEDVDQLEAWSNNGADLVVEISGSRPGLVLAAQLVRPGGRIGVLGYAADTEFCMNSAKLVLGEVSVTGCRGGSLEDAREAIEALHAGEIQLDIAERLPLREVNTALDRLRHPRHVGRVVLDLDQ
jgi:D-arabinose 1-dehydrogenase-like Zn-dependent alcohol dehydrogenase